MAIINKEKMVNKIIIIKLLVKFKLSKSKKIDRKLLIKSVNKIG